MIKVIYIEGMMCERCKKHVEDALNKIGVSAEVSLSENKATTNNLTIENETIIKAIEDAGYEVKEITNE